MGVLKFLILLFIRNDFVRVSAMRNAVRLAPMIQKLNQLCECPTVAVLDKLLPVIVATKSPKNAENDRGFSAANLLLETLRWLVRQRRAHSASSSEYLSATEHSLVEQLSGSALRSITPAELNNCKDVIGLALHICTGSKFIAETDGAVFNAYIDAL